VKKDIKVVPETYAQFMMFLDARRRCIVLNNSTEGQTDGEQGKGGVMT
jgi:hypothetical protein